MKSSPSAGLSETEGERDTVYKSIDLIHQLNLKTTHPILTTHSSAASSSGGQQAASEAAATQHES